VDDETRRGILGGRAVAHEILPAHGFQLVAIDHAEPYAARFNFRVDEGGDFDLDTEIVHPEGRHGWEPIGSGGTYGAGWELPWIPPVDGWGFGHLWALGLCGLDVEHDDGDRLLIAVYGFASGATDAIRVHTERSTRTITPEHTGAFVALAAGRGDQFVELTPLRAGIPLSTQCALPSPP
jgi:hypothetical protein